MPVVETDSIVGLTSHVCTGNLASVVPNSILDSIELNGMLRALPIMEPEVNHTIGLVVSKRFPIQPVVKTLINEARRLSTAPLLATG